MTFEIVDKVNSDKIQELLRDNKYLLNDYYKKKIWIYVNTLDKNLSFSGGFWPPLTNYS